MIRQRLYITLLLLSLVLGLVMACSPQMNKAASLEQHTLAELKVLAKDIKYNRNFSSVSYPVGKDKVLVNRLQKGTVSPEVADSIITYLARDNSDTLSVLAIQYYPAQTLSNATGSFGTADFRRIYRELDQQITSLRQTRSIYVNRPGAYLDRYAKAASWIPDELLFMERYFVPHPQLGTSYVVINKFGNYELYLGEHSNAATIKSFLRIYRQYQERIAE